jgi:hypothetical protein
MYEQVSIAVAFGGGFASHVLSFTSFAGMFKQCTSNIDPDVGDAIIMIFCSHSLFPSLVDLLSQLPSLDLNYIPIPSVPVLIAKQYLLAGILSLHHLL